VRRCRRRWPEWVAQVKLPPNLRLAIDIDPQSF
jgi:hypothetical protein